jgi:hypothetical protein
VALESEDPVRILPKGWKWWDEEYGVEKHYCPHCYIDNDDSSTAETREIAGE